MKPGKSIRIGVRLPVDLHAWLIDQVGTRDDFSNLSQTVISILNDRRVGR